MSTNDNLKAHEELIDAIMNAPKMMNTLMPPQMLNTYWPNGVDAVMEVVRLAEAAPERPDRKKLWKIGSEGLQIVHDTWATKFSLVAQKLQAGARFAPSEIRVSTTNNKLDPDLFNVLPDGWHHQPITEALEP